MKNKVEILSMISAREEAEMNMAVKNIEMICDNPVGIGEHGDIVDTVHQLIKKVEKHHSLRQMAEDLIDNYEDME